MENFFGLENKEEVEYELEKPKQNNVFDYVKKHCKPDKIAV